MAKFNRKQEDQPQASGPAVVGNVDHDLVAQKAYERYLSRGGGDGQDLDDWLIAEREVSGGRRPGEDVIGGRPFGEKER